MKKIIILAFIVSSCSSTQLAYQNRTKKYFDKKITNMKTQLAKT